MSLASGTRLGAYEIVALIGAGGMGEVYRARDTRLKREVAIKVLPDAFANDPDRLARFQREAELLATLNHPNIAQIHGLEDRALVLELVEGPTLADRIAQGAIPLDEALAIAKQIADALEAAHERGVIHRDLKPANIKLTSDGTVKVLDFGLAKAISPDASTPSNLSMSPTITSPAMTMGGVILGTAAYMSPEQARGKPVDKRADIWAFGCVLYEMLAGVRAFDGEEVSDILAAILRAEPDWTKLPAHAPRAITGLLGRCLAKDPKNRLRDIGDARLDLHERFAAPVSQSALLSTGRRSGRLQLLRYVTAVALGASIAVGIIWLEKSGEPTSSQLRRFELMPSSTLPLLLNAARTIAVSADGGTVAYVSADFRLVVRRLEILEPIALPDLGPVAWPFFSPDSQSLVFQTVDSRELRKVSLAGGPPVTIAKSQYALRGATWTTDSDIVFATADAASGMLVVNSGGGTPTTLIEPDPKGDERYSWPQAIPGTRLVLFTILRSTQTGGSPDVAHIAVFNRDTKERKVLIAGKNARYTSTGHLVYASGATLFAVSFDLDRLEAIGQPVPIVANVQTTGPGASNFDISDDGSLLYVPGTEGQLERTLVWVDRLGKEENIALPSRAYNIPRVSPDGTRLAAGVEASGNEDIVVYDLARKSEMRLTFDTGAETRPYWSPDGKWIYFRSTVKGAGVYRKASDGRGEIELVVPVSGDGAANGMSRDLKWIFFSNVSGPTGRDIWMLGTAEGSKPQPLIAEPGNQGNPALSPDGRWIAYQDETQGFIYVRPFPDVNGGRWQVSPANSKWPAWSPDGRELFFVGGSALNRGLLSVGVDAEQSTFRYTAPRTLLNRSYSGFLSNVGARGYDLSPDGKRFLVVKETGSETAPRAMVLVENWFEELQQRVPTK